MEYEVTRTSCLFGKPCTEAFSKRLPQYVQIKNIYSYNEIADRYNTPRWEDEGTEHSYSDGYYKRREQDEEVWFVEINSLEELKAFVSKYERVIITGLTLEIYDDYRE
jgi:hypothetical protein